MKLRFHIALMVGCCWFAAPGLGAQSAPTQKPPATTPQQQPAQKPTESNPFPEDTTSVPVVPTSGEPAAPPAEPPAAASGAGATTTSLLRGDTDPARSPDDPTADASGSDGFSSSLTGTNDVNIPDELKPTKRKRGSDEPPPEHHETAHEDENVGSYYLSQKNWRAALSRFESALVTDPENPEVYWGLAEAQRQLGDFAKAKANYQKVMEYDPDSKHAKEAKKWLKEPQFGNATAAGNPAGAAAPK